MLELKQENPNSFRGSTATELFDELFGTNWKEQDRLESFAQWAINSKTEANVEPMLVFWRAQSHRFRDCVIYSDYYPPVTHARDSLMAIIDSLVCSLKAIRKDLSERHNIAPEAGQQLLNVYKDPFRL